MFYKIILFLFIFSFNSVYSMNQVNHNRRTPVFIRTYSTGEQEELTVQNTLRNRRLALTDQQVREITDLFGPEEREIRN